MVNKCILRNALFACFHIRSTERVGRKRQVFVTLPHSCLYKSGIANYSAMAVMKTWERRQCNQSLASHIRCCYSYYSPSYLFAGNVGKMNKFFQSFLYFLISDIWYVQARHILAKDANPLLFTSKREVLNVIECKCVPLLTFTTNQYMPYM